MLAFCTVGFVICTRLVSTVAFCGTGVVLLLNFGDLMRATSMHLLI